MSPSAIIGMCIAALNLQCSYVRDDSYELFLNSQRRVDVLMWILFELNPEFSWRASDYGSGYIRVYLGRIPSDTNTTISTHS